MKFGIIHFAVLFTLFTVGCASESNQALKVEKSQSETTASDYQGKE